MTDTEQPIGFHRLVTGGFCTLVLDRSECDGDDSVARASQSSCGPSGQYRSGKVNRHSMV